MSHALRAGNYGDVSFGQGARGQHQQNHCLVGEGHHLVVADVRMRIPVSETSASKMRESWKGGCENGLLRRLLMQQLLVYIRSKRPEILPVGL